MEHQHGSLNQFVPVHEKKFIFLNKFAAINRSEIFDLSSDNYVNLVKFFETGAIDRTKTLITGFKYNVIDPIPQITTSSALLLMSLCWKLLETSWTLQRKEGKKFSFYGAAESTRPLPCSHFLKYVAKTPLTSSAWAPPMDPSWNFRNSGITLWDKNLKFSRWFIRYRNTFRRIISSSLASMETSCSVVIICSPLLNPDWETCHTKNIYLSSLDLNYLHLPASLPI